MAMSRMSRNRNKQKANNAAHRKQYEPRCLLVVAFNALIEAAGAVNDALEDGRIEVVAFLLSDGRILAREF